MGKSGSGKSVTWLAALGLLGTRAPIGGEVLFEGADLVGAPAGALEAVRGARIAMIFQDPLEQASTRSIASASSSPRRCSSIAA